MLVAPAGYGKTTLARQWLASRPHAWYQGDASSSDVAALALGLAQAAEPVVSDAGRRLKEWLPTSREPEQEVEIIEQFLAEDLEEWPEDGWFVIDDYQLLSSVATEDLVRRLFASGRRRLLLTSRQRPLWSSARDLLYGNIFELGQSSLAMDPAEANAVLASKDNDAASGLVALADGWPAVIGLAALAPGSAMLEEELPDELHDYFAEELFASLPDGTRDGLCRLALVPAITRESAEALVGSRAEHVIAGAREAGMLSGHRGNELTFHPLLRTFLMRKLREAPRAELVTPVTRAVEVLVQAESWNEAFALITAFARYDLVDQVISHSIVPLTKQGRLSTLRAWLDILKRAEFSSPLSKLVEAELAFRHGHQDRGGVLAETAASSLGSDHPLLSLAHYRAGQSRHLADDSDGALEHFKAAYSSADSDLDARNALWGQFLVQLELESNEALLLFDRLQSLASPSSDDAVRNECGRLMLAMGEGGRIPTATELTLTRERAREASDPLIRSAVLRAVAALLVLSAEYEQALGAAREAIDEAERFHLGFVRPHTLVSEAAASLGLRRFTDAARVLDELDDASREMNDPYLAANADILRCRLFLTEGSPSAALEAVSGEWSRGPTPARKMEFAATKAAALASAGAPEAALKELDKVEGISTSLEATLLFRWVRAMCSLLTQSYEAEAELRSAYEATRAAQAFDSLIFVSRLHPRIVDMLAEEEGVREELSVVLGRVDETRLQGRGPRLDRRQTARAPLTEREEEVYSLLAEGRSNREIATALFISESTAKVHVRNILRKLGARTRTEAAIQAARRLRPQEPAEENRKRGS